MEQMFEAAMVLGAVGDAMGYRDWDWECCQSGSTMMQQLKELGGIKKLKLNPDSWPVSDETIMHMATARALIAGIGNDKTDLYHGLCRSYVACVGDVLQRRPEPIFVEACRLLRPGNVMSWHIPFNSKATGFGAATKAMCIGLRFSRPEQILELIEVAIESGRMTHNHPIGFMGSVCTALFASFAIQKLPIAGWGRKMLCQMGRVKTYCTKTIRHKEEYGQCWFYFETKWEIYLKERGIFQDGQDEPKFPSKYGVVERDEVYKTWSSEGHPGRRGHDVAMIAYDALLGVMEITSDEERWEELCHRAMIHAGKTDSTGAIAGFLYGALFGFAGVPGINHECIEFRKDLVSLGRQLYEQQYPDSE